MNRAFITGITGQDGSYLCELLLEKGYEVHGLVHRPEGLRAGNLAHLFQDEKIFNQRLFLHTGSFEDATHLRRLIFRAKPTEFYHLAAQSSPRLSLELPETTMESVGMATVRLLEILRDLDNPPRFLYASSSEIFGAPTQMPQDELTPVQPSTPYGVAKALSTQMAKIYRLAYGINSCAAILYNHESPRRSGQFVTMKIARAAARIKLGRQKKIQLGSLAGQRDWGWAPDYVRGLWQILQLPTVDEFVLATGQLHSVQEFVECAFQVAGLNWRDHVEYDASLITPVEPAHLCGNPAKARRVLGWENQVPFEAMVERLVASELDAARRSTPLATV
ncbi:MAG: GDP-mannose 4,6-dehydratase [Opitutales bacterium]|jgi:GDPmannose 4,6-dehydratase